MQAQLKLSTQKLGPPLPRRVSPCLGLGSLAIMLCNDMGHGTNDQIPRGGSNKNTHIYPFPSSHASHKIRGPKIGTSRQFQRPSVSDSGSGHIRATQPKALGTPHRLRQISNIYPGPCFSTQNGGRLVFMRPFPLAITIREPSHSQRHTTMKPLLFGNSSDRSTCHMCGAC